MTNWLELLNSGKEIGREELMMNASDRISSTKTNNSTSTNNPRERTFPSWSDDELRNALAALLNDRPVRIEVAGGIVRHHWV